LPQQLATLEGQSELARPLRLGAFEDLELVELGPQAGETAGGTLILLAAAPGASALDVSASAAGAAWRELASREGLRVVSASLAASARGPGPWLAICEALHQECDELVVVATGELALLLPAELARADARPIDGLVLFDSPAARAPADPEAACPTLLLEGGAAEAGDELAGPPETRWTRRSRLEPDLALRGELPRFVGEWLDSE
jgi:hypothetical protein